MHNRQVRQIRNAADAMELPNELFRKIYRLNKETFRYLVNEINPYLPDVEREGLGIPKDLVVLCALHFYAQGSYQKGVGQDFNSPMSQFSVSRCIELVTDILVENFGDKIKFPSTEAKRDREKVKFFNELNGFPGKMRKCIIIRFLVPQIKIIVNQKKWHHFLFLVPTNK